MLNENLNLQGIVCSVSQCCTFSDPTVAFVGISIKSSGTLKDLILSFTDYQRKYMLKELAKINRQIRGKNKDDLVQTFTTIALIGAVAYLLTTSHR